MLDASLFNIKIINEKISVNYPTEHIIYQLLLQLDFGLAAGEGEVAAPEGLYIVHILGLQLPPRPEVAPNGCLQ